MSVPAGRPFRLLAVVVAAALAAPLALSGCASKPKSELAATSEPAAKPDDKPDEKKDGNSPAAAPAEVKKLSEAESDPGPPLARHEAAGQCWMIADKRGGSIEAKTKIVDKCIDDKLKADAVKRSEAPAGR
ncbi:MAG: hypothetical protein AB7O50_01220 [Pseudolabrys sp.]